LIAVAFTVKFCVEPAVIERLLEESVRVKSGWGMLFSDERLDPHATKRSMTRHAKPTNSCFLNRELLKVATANAEHYDARDVIGANGGRVIVLRRLKGVCVA
jgi:hypothetical protein